MQPTMSLDFIQYPSSEITDPMRDDPCYPPPLQLTGTDAPSSELFDQEFDNDEEVSEFYRNLSSEQIGALFNSRDTNPAISTKISTLSAFTDSTDSTHEIASSQYSFNVTSSESDYLNPSEFETHGSVNSSLYSAAMQASISSAAEFADRLPYTPLNPAEAHGSMYLNSNFADGYSTAMQQLESVTCVDPAALTQAAHVISDSEVQMAPVKKPFKCPHCSFSSARKHNLKTHIGTHDKEASKRFGCSTCGRRFSRKHDLHRHHETIHRDRMSSSSSSSSASGVSSRRYCTTTVSGDERLTSSGSFTDTGLEDLVARWDYATWFQGA